MSAAPLRKDEQRWRRWCLVSPAPGRAWHGNYRVPSRRQIMLFRAPPMSFGDVRLQRQTGVALPLRAASQRVPAEYRPASLRAAIRVKRARADRQNRRGLGSSSGPRETSSSKVPASSGRLALVIRGEHVVARRFDCSDGARRRTDPPRVAIAQREKNGVKAAPSRRAKVDETAETSRLD